MFDYIGKSGTGIGKSGTGIGKSGTGIGKSGTGIGKSGTGSWRDGLIVMLVVPLLLTAASLASAAQSPQLFVTQDDVSIMLSIHGPEGIVVGAMPVAGGVEGYHVIALQQSLGFIDDRQGLLVKGSGSGSSGESDCRSDSSLMVKGSGSGSSGEGKCDPGSSLMVKGSGSGSSGESTCDDGGSLMVKGSGSGSYGKGPCDPQGGFGVLVKGSGSGSVGGCAMGGSGLLVKGSGSGSSGEAMPGCAPLWGYAELVLDAEGTHIVVHRAGGSGFEEYLVGFIANPDSALADNGTGETPREFISIP